MNHKTKKGMMLIWAESQTTGNIQTFQGKYISDHNHCPSFREWYENGGVPAALCAI